MLNGFITRKISRGLSRIDAGLDNCLYLGNLNSKRDWGHARDYIEMQWLMLQQDNPVDYVIATGRQESVRTFVELAAKKLNWYLKEDEPAIIWEGEGVDEVGIRADTKEIVIKIDPRYYRPSEVDTLLGDPSRASRELGWVPKCSLEELVEEMIDFDVREAKKEVFLKKGGYKLNSN